MVKKIGILTFHHVINDGAILQAYALAQTVRKFFPADHVEIIDYCSKKAEWEYFLLALKSRSLVETTHKIFRYLKLKKFIATQLLLSKQRLVTDDYSKAVAFLKLSNYDLIIVGSDEVWKITEGKFSRPFPNIYWLSPELNAKKVSFAASGNRTRYIDLSDDKKKWLRDRLLNFDHITVRDNHTVAFLQFLGLDKKMIEYVPDPTFMLSLDENKQIKDKLARMGVDFSRKNAGVMIGEKKLNEKFCKYLKKNGFFVVGLSFYSKYADVNLIDKLDPLEWRSAIKYLNLCITDRFHGSIFCIKNKTPFIVLESIRACQDYESKVRTLLQHFSLMQCLREVDYEFPDLAGLNEQIEKVSFALNGNNLDRILDEANNACLRVVQKMKDILK